MERAYALALWKAVEGGTEPKAAVRTLHESLVAHGRAGLMPHIARAFERLAIERGRRDLVQISVAREGDAHTAVAEAKPVIERFGEGVEVDVRVDETLIGGWRLEGRETLVDASHKKYLLDMFGRVTA